MLQQSHSRYEVQGEYTIPPTATIPRTAASLALAAPATASAAGGGSGTAAPTQPSPAEAEWNIASGRWRVQVSPAAQTHPHLAYSSCLRLEHLPSPKATEADDTSNKIQAARDRLAVRRKRTYAS